MSTLFVILGIIFTLLFIKFIWDSYLTDNTEKRWREYKQEFPAEADRIESNSGLDFKRTPYESNLRTKPGDLKHRIPGFISFYSQLHPALLANVSVNDATRFEFKMPVRIYGNTVGYNHVGILDRNRKLEMYFYSISERGKKLTLDPYPISGDLSVLEYENILNSFVKKMMANPNYQKLAVGADFNESDGSIEKKFLTEAVRFSDLGKNQLAIQKLKEVISYNPNFPDAYLLLIDALLSEGDIFHAAEYIGKLNVKSMKREIQLTSEKQKIFRSLKFRRFEMEDKQKKKDFDDDDDLPF